MKLTKQTIEIISSLSKINDGLVFKTGNVLRARAKGAPNPIVEVQFASQSFPTDFALYNINQFLTMLSMFDVPVLEFGETELLIKDEQSTRSARIKYASEKNIVHMPYASKIKEQPIALQFKLLSGDLKSLIKAGSTLASPEYVFQSDGSKFIVGTFNHKNSGIDKYQVELQPDLIPDDPFTVIITADHLQLLNRDYTVYVAKSGLVRFCSENDHDTINYWITVHEKTTFE